MRGRDVDKPVVTGAASLISAGAASPSGDPVRPDPVLSEDELTEIRLHDIAFGDADELDFG